MTLLLNDENYHSPEANKEFMSVSQFKEFRQCEAAALAKLNGEVEESSNPALLVGSYVHAHFEGNGALEKLVGQHPEMFASTGKTKGQLKSEFQIANKVIERIESDPFCMFVLDGDKEVIITQELGGVMWKAKLDVLNREKGRFVDLKTGRDLYARHWSTRYGTWVSFVEHYDYPIQMSTYAELERLDAKRETYLEPLMVAASKEQIPAIEIVTGFADRIDLELKLMLEALPRVLAVKEGRELPTRCDKCEYCRSTRKLNRMIHYADLIN